MALLPTISEEVVEEFEYTQDPGLTYRMRVEQENGTAGRIIGHIDGRDAVEQAVYKILNTQRGENEIYRGQYGVELDDLIGMPIPYVVPEVDRRIKEALLMDDRIEAVGAFKFDIPKRGVLHVTFLVTSIYGDITINQDIEVA
jgi:phage baseplate assembly protein W